jgi:hypothetical protein
VAAVVFVSLTLSGGNPVDAYNYWHADPAHPYATGEFKFVYTPVAIQVLAPFQTLPFPVFVALVRLIDLAALVLLAGPATVFAIFLPPVATELNAANINLPLGLAVVAAFRWPALWAFPVLTKITPLVGVVWFAARKEWRSCAIAVGTTLVILVVSILASPTLWRDYVDYLLSVADTVPGWPFPYPMLPRVVLALVLLLWGARTDRRWTVPVAVLIALPRLYFLSPALLLAVLPTLHGGWGSIERWSPRGRRAE